MLRSVGNGFMPCKYPMSLNADNETSSWFFHEPVFPEESNFGTSSTLSLAFDMLGVLSLSIKTHRAHNLQ